MSFATSAPLKSIAGAATGSTLNTGGLRVDASGNMYVANNFRNNLGTISVQVGIEGFVPTSDRQGCAGVVLRFDCL